MEFAKDKYRLFMEHLPDAFAYHQIVTDSSGNPVDYIFLEVNPVIYEMTGFPKDKIIGKKKTGKPHGAPQPPPQPGLRWFS